MITAQAVILAGGLGTRLWPITKEVPKPMVPVAGAPYLEHQLKLLQRQGFRDIVLLTGYLGEQIETHFGDGSRWDLRIKYSRETTPLGTGGALREALPLLHDDFLLLYGDSFLPMNYAGVLGRLRETSTLATVVVYDNRLADTSVKNNIALTTNGFVARYDKDRAQDTELTHVEAGVLALTRGAVELIPTGKVSLEQEIFPRLIEQRQLSALSTTQRFYDIGTPDRLRVIEEYLQHDHHAHPVSH